MVGTILNYTSLYLISEMLVGTLVKKPNPDSLQCQPYVIRNKWWVRQVDVSPTYTGRNHNTILPEVNEVPNSVDREQIEQTLSLVPSCCLFVLSTRSELGTYIV